MTIRQSINKVRFRLYNAITNHKFVEICMIIVIASYIPLLIIGSIIAAVFSPEGYTIWNNWISDLGTSAHTPAPYLYDIACILAGTLTIPFTFYAEKLLAPMPKTVENLRKTSRLRLRIGGFALVFNLIGNVSYIGVGIFSGDRNYYGLHNVTSALAFGGFAFGAFFLGLLIVFYDTKIPKLIGLYGMVGPMTVIILYPFMSSPFMEWLLLFSILAWIIPFSLVTFNKKE